VGRKDAADKGRLRVECQQDVALSNSKEDMPPWLPSDHIQTENARVKAFDLFQIVRIDGRLDNGFDLWDCGVVHLASNQRKFSIIRQESGTTEGRSPAQM
jgi:hypothetical protein